MKLSGIVIILVAAITGSVHAQSGDAAVQSRIVALEQLWNQAYKSGDTKALNSILDDAIVLVNDDGSVQTKAEFLARQVVHVAAQCPATAGSAGIAGRPCVRKCGDSNRSYEGEGHRERQVL